MSTRMRAEDWANRGREARGRGWDRRAPAGLRGENRAAWFRGWDAENGERAAAKATPAERAEALEVSRRLRAWAVEQSARLGVKLAAADEGRRP